MMTTTEMIAKIEDARATKRAMAIKDGKDKFPIYDRAVEDTLFTSGLKNNAHAEMIFAIDPIDDELGTWCEIKKEKGGYNTYTDHHAFPVVIADYVKRLRDAGYSVNVSNFSLEIFSKSGNTNYGKYEFRTLYISF